MIMLLSFHHLFFGFYLQQVDEQRVVNRFCRLEAEPGKLTHRILLKEQQQCIF